MTTQSLPEAEETDTEARWVHGRWMLIGGLVVAVCAWVVFGDGLWGLLTSAREPDDLDPAVFAEASVTQWEAVADGLVTRIEYEAAYNREIACIQAVDPGVSIIGPDWDRMGWTLGYTSESSAGPDATDRCAREHRALTEVVWVEQPPDAEVVGAMGSTVVNCVDAVRTARSTQGCPDALVEAVPAA